jgi:hypothetical protein
MKDFLGLGWTVTASLALAGCGGNVVVDGPAGTGGATTTSSTSSTIPGTTTSGTTSNTSTSTGFGTTSSSGGPCVMTCNQAFNNGGPPPCGGAALMDYDGLLSCACATTGPCATSCTYNLCLHEAPPGTCAMCLQANCGGQFMNCVGN